MNSEQKQILQKTFEKIIQYIESLKNNDLLVHYKTPEELKSIFKFEIGDQGSSVQEIEKHLDNYLKYSVKTGNRQFFNQLYAGFNFPAFLGEVITALTNTSMYTFEVAPVATLMEIELMNKMCSIVGFDNGEGTFVTGGSNANLMAMLCARNEKIKAAKYKGITGEKRLTLFVSDRAHYSFEKGANLTGIGMENVIKVKSNAIGKIIPEELENEIQQSLQRDEIPFFIAATTGTTLLGSYDPIPEMSKIAKKYDLWLHADGSWGGSALLSKKHKHLLKGSELADSFAWNPHKMMNTPLVTSALLFKEKGTMMRNFSSGNTDYIFHDYDNATFDLGPKSMQCGKKVDSLKLWLSWKYYGDKGYEKRVNKQFEMAGYFEECIKQDDHFELLVPRQSLNVCFRYRPENKQDLNQFNLALRNNVMKAGKSMINYGYYGDTVAIRFVLVNPEVEKEDIDTLLVNIREEAAKLDA